MDPNVVVAAVVGDIALVTMVSSALGAAARRCQQPTVIGQILAGVLLGPSVLGRLPGHLTSRVFPAYALPFLTVLAQVAVVIFMFAVGYETEFSSLRRFGRAVPLVTTCSLLVPMGLGVGTVLLFGSEFTAVGERNVHSRSFLLFVAVAISITALPVLAAIVRDRGLAGTTAGVIATSAAGIMDGVAWLVLAAALIGSQHSPDRPLWLTVLLLICLVAAMLLGVRPALRWWTARRRSVLASPVPTAFALAMGSAWITTTLGLHPIFGGFLAGLTMRGWNSEPDADVLRTMDQAGNLLLPLFFVVTGLSLNIGTLRGEALATLALVFVVAGIGKLGPAYAASRISGLDPRQSGTIAALVNARGLTELIALNIGLGDGIIHQRLFTILVLMALITTAMTGLLLSLLRPVLPQTSFHGGSQIPEPSADGNPS